MKEGDFCNKNVKIMNILIVITDVCKDPNTLRTIKFIYDAIKILYYIIPIILIVMITLDVAKNVVATDSEIGKNTSLIVKRIIAVILLFLVPNIVSFVLNIVETPKENINETFESCLTNIEDIPHWEKVYERLKEDDDKRFKEEYLSHPYTLSIQHAKRQIFSSSDTSGNTTGGGIVHGQSYNLNSQTLKDLAAKCTVEQGNNVAGAAAEASLMANLYELHGSGYPTLYDYVLNSGWFGPSSSILSAIASNPPSQDVIDAVKDVLVNGNRTLPLYVDEHDCWFCHERFNDQYKWCANGNIGDICSIETNGKKMTSKSEITNRSNYKQDNTKIKTVYGTNKGEGTEYYTFYIFPTDSSDPFGYTPGAYATIKGSE